MQQMQPTNVRARARDVANVARKKSRDCAMNAAAAGYKKDVDDVGSVGFKKGETGSL